MAMKSRFSSSFESSLHRTPAEVAVLQKSFYNKISNVFYYYLIISYNKSLIKSSNSN